MSALLTAKIQFVIERALLVSPKIRVGTVRDVLKLTIDHLHSDVLSHATKVTYSIIQSSNVSSRVEFDSTLSKLSFLVHRGQIPHTTSNENGELTRFTRVIKKLVRDSERITDPTSTIRYAESLPTQTSNSCYADSVMTIILKSRFGEIWRRGLTNPIRDTGGKGICSTSSSILDPESVTALAIEVRKQIQTPMKTVDGLRAVISQCIPTMRNGNAHSAPEFYVLLTSFFPNSLLSLPIRTNPNLEIRKKAVVQHDEINDQQSHQAELGSVNWKLFQGEFLVVQSSSVAYTAPKMKLENGFELDACVYLNGGHYVCLFRKVAQKNASLKASQSETKMVLEPKAPDTKMVLEPKAPDTWLYYDGASAQPIREWSGFKSSTIPYRAELAFYVRSNEE